MAPHTATSARGVASKRKVGRPGKSHKPYSIKARLDIAQELERLAATGVTRTELFEAAAAIALRDEEAFLAEVHAQRMQAEQHRLASESSDAKEGPDVAA